MSHVPFADLPPDARLWCFGASRPLEDEETARIETSMASFLSEWTAHRRDLHAGFEWAHGRFLVVAVDESRADASGCSIDALTRRLKELGAELGLDLLDGAPVWFRDADGAIRTTSRTDFVGLAREGTVGPGTRVFDLTVDRVGRFRERRLESAAGDAWHRMLLTSD